MVRIVAVSMPHGSVHLPVISEEVLVGSIFSLVQVIFKVMIIIFSIHKIKSQALLCDGH